MRIYSSGLNEDAAHRLLKGCIVPRPIAWISTVGENGINNLAPFSCFTFVSTLPPMIAISIARRNGEKKDTLRNIEFCGEFVVNVVSENAATAVNITSADYPAEVNEFEKAGLTAIPSEIVRAPRISESPIQMECRLEYVLNLGQSHHSLVIAKVLLFHVQDALYKEGEIDQAALRPLARLAGDNYGQLGKIFELPRGVI
jgi:flavin reductase (DIM6/NTAB) family NADH-FMN oxidoreductase RutF